MKSKEPAHRHDQARAKRQPPQPNVQNLAKLTWPGQLASVVQQARLDPGSLTAQNVLQLQRAIGNKAVEQLLGHQPANQAGDAAMQRLKSIAVIQRAGGKIDPGQALPSLVGLAKERFDKLYKPDIEATAKAREIADAQHNIKDRMFTLNVFNMVMAVRQRANLAPPLLSDLEEAERIIEAVLNGATDLNDAKDVASDLMENPHKRGRKNLIVTFVNESKKYSTTQAKLNPTTNRGEISHLPQGTEATPENLATAFFQARAGIEMPSKPLTKSQKKAFAAALKSMPTIQYLLEKHKSKETPISIAQWANGGFLSDNITESTKNDKTPPTDGTVNPRTDIDNGKFKRRVDDADQYVRTLVEPHLLAEIPRPGIIVHLKYSGGLHKSVNTFRAFQSGHEVNVAQDEGTPTIVHEVGHYLEDNLPSELWHDIHIMLRARHLASVQKSGKEYGKVGHGESGMRGEGRYRGDYAATGKYTSSAYGGAGSTEMTSMTMEFLADPDRVKTMIEQDPQQTAIILRGLRPREYAQTQALRAFDQYIPH